MYDNFGSFDGWIRKIFVNQALNFYRYNKVFLQVSADDLNLISEENSNDALFDDYSTKKILDSIQKLPNKQRIVFNMIEVEGESYEDVAKFLNVSQECIRSQNSNAKKKLRELLYNIKKSE